MPTVYGWDLTFQPASGSGVPSGVTVYGWAGLGVPYTAATASVLYAQRVGSGGIALMNADTLATYTDSGSPDYAYDGTGGSDELLVEALKADGTAYAAGDEVGVPYAWDEIQEVGLYAVAGSMGTLRDSGYTGIDASTNVDAVRTIGGSLTDYTYLVDATLGSTGGVDLFLPGSGAAGIRLYVPFLGSARARIHTGSSTSSIAIVSGSYGSTRTQFIVSYESSTGTVRLRTYTAAGGYLNANTNTGTTGLDMRTAHSIGTLLGSTVHRITVWEGYLSDAACDAIADGSDLTGRAGLGGSDLRVHDWTGLRSGCYRAAAPTELPVQTASGTGAPTAEY